MKNKPLYCWAFRYNGGDGCVELENVVRGSKTEDSEGKDFYRPLAVSINVSQPEYTYIDDNELQFGSDSLRMALALKPKGAITQPHNWRLFVLL